MAISGFKLRQAYYRSDSDQLVALRLRRHEIEPGFRMTQKILHKLHFVEYSFAVVGC
jgi:hypothetical protein